MNPETYPGAGSWPVHRWFADVVDVERQLAAYDYLADRGLATAVFLATSLNLPLLLEGEVGVGKTEVAKAVAQALDRRVVRLQCYEGIDSSQALYEWDYPRQLLYLRAVGDTRSDKDSVIEDLYGPRFLNERPLLEVLADFQISIPEIGAIRAEQPPIVVLTTNRTRELHDALKRRCLYHWIDYPDLDREMAIVRARVPELPEDLARRIVEAVHRFRRLDLIKLPGIAETINWALTLDLLGVDQLEPDPVAPTLGALLKEREDIDRVKPLLEEILD